ncbi:MAG TPA: cupin domain-containing protein [Polyangiaceae bacterium]|nr:cupin domain-containing protein [Polyangiaceae bacterium]
MPNLSRWSSRLASAEVHALVSLLPLFGTACSATAMPSTTATTPSSAVAPTTTASSAAAGASAEATPSPIATRSPAPAAATSATGISRTLLDQADLPDMPGWETRLFLIEYAPGVAAPKHHHPVGGVGYVLSGSFESAFEGQKPTIVREGQSFRDLPEASHVLFRNADNSKSLKFIIMYVVRKGEPVLMTP